MKLLPRKPGLHTLGLPLRVLPDRFTHEPLTRLVNKLFHEPVEEGDFDFLENRCLKIQITDLELNFHVSFDGEKLQVGGARHYDVEFRGSAKAFMLLATRQEDPDTLFFQRSLMIEGDTELGLGVKNLLDSLDLEELLPERWFKAVALVQRIPLTTKPFTTQQRHA